MQRNGCLFWFLAIVFLIGLLPGTPFLGCNFLPFWTAKKLANLLFLVSCRSRLLFYSVQNVQYMDCREILFFLLLQSLLLSGCNCINTPPGFFICVCSIEYNMNKQQKSIRVWVFHYKTPFKQKHVQMC